jgi:cyclopropane fatty-acyl-phospholipid synthase-like methyltransferase
MRELFYFGFYKKFFIFGTYELAAISSNPTAAKNSATNNSTSNNIKVQLLGVNDFHGQLNKYQSVSGTMAGGAEYLAAYLKMYNRKIPTQCLFMLAIWWEEVRRSLHNFKMNPQ